MREKRFLCVYLFCNLNTRLHAHISSFLSHFSSFFFEAPFAWVHRKWKKNPCFTRRKFTQRTMVIIKHWMKEKWKSQQNSISTSSVAVCVKTGQAVEEIPFCLAGFSKTWNRSHDKLTSSLHCPLIALINCKSVSSAPFFYTFSQSHWIGEIFKCDYENLLLIYGLLSKPHPKHCHVTRSQSIFSAFTCCILTCMCSKCISHSMINVFLPFDFSVVCPKNFPWLLEKFEMRWNGHLKVHTNTHSCFRAWMKHLKVNANCI